jgi:hypothetical protein
MAAFLWHSLWNSTAGRYYGWNETVGGGNTTGIAAAVTRFTGEY